MTETHADITGNSKPDTQGKNYVCPQCGPDPAGADAHAESFHTWPPRDGEVSLREWIAKHSDHVDEGVHQVQATVDRLETMILNMMNQVSEMHAELDAARPLIEKWQHSTIARLARGQMPWQQT